MEAQSNNADPMAGRGLEEIVATKLDLVFSGVDLHHFDNLDECVIGPCQAALLKYVLGRTGGNQVQAAKVLGINRATLLKRMRRHRIAQQRLPRPRNLTEAMASLSAMRSAARNAGLMP